MALSLAQILDYVQLGQSLDCLDILVNTDGDSQEVAQRKIARAQDISMNRLTRGTTAERALMINTPFQHRFYDTDLGFFVTWNGSAWLSESGFDVDSL
jgi:hypothetical protein